MPIRGTKSQLALLAALMLSSQVSAGVQLPVLISYEPDGRQISTEVQHSVISPTGRFALFLVSGPAGPGERVCFRWYLRDRELGTTEIISRKANGDSVTCDHQVFRGTAADIDSSGRFVVFDQYGGNIVPDAPVGMRVYLRDRVNGSVRLIGPSPENRAAHPSMDDAGRRVAMIAAGSLQVYDAVSNQLISAPTTRSPNDPIMSGDGRRVAFIALPEGSIFTVRSQIYLLHVDDGRVELLSAAPDGSLGDDRSFNPTINFDGSVVAFESTATNLVPGGRARMIIRHVEAGTAEGVRNAHGQAIFGSTPSISGDGLRLAFAGYDPVSPVFPEQAFIWDRITRNMTLVSRNAAGEHATLGLVSFRCVPNPSPCIATDYSDFNPTISTNGRVVAFVSRGPNLVSNDANGTEIDVYAADVGSVGGTSSAVPLSPALRWALAALVIFVAALVQAGRPAGGVHR